MMALGGFKFARNNLLLVHECHVLPLDHSPGGESPGRADLPASTPRHAGAAVPASAAGPAADAAARRVLHLGPAVVDQRPHHRRPVRALRPAAAATAVGGPGGAAAPPPPSPPTAATAAAPPAPATGAVWRARQAGWRRPRHGRELRRRRGRPAVAGEGAPGPPPVRRREARAAAATATLKMSWMGSRTIDQKPWRTRCCESWRAAVTREIGVGDGRWPAGVGKQHWPVFAYPSCC